MVWLILCTGLPVAGAKAQYADSVAIVQVLSNQEAAWNRGDLMQFMAGYWNSPRLRFVSKRGVTHGWAQTLANYQRAYPTPEAMGRLQFRIESVERLARTQALVIGEWKVAANGTESGGYFTLLFRKIRGTWVIVLDHTS